MCLVACCLMVHVSEGVVTSLYQEESSGYRAVQATAATGARARRARTAAAAAAGGGAAAAAEAPRRARLGPPVVHPCSQSGRRQGRRLHPCLEGVMLAPALARAPARAAATWARAVPAVT